MEIVRVRFWGLLEHIATWAGAPADKENVKWKKPLARDSSQRTWQWGQNNNIETIRLFWSRRIDYSGYLVSATRGPICRALIKSTSPLIRQWNFHEYDDSIMDTDLKKV